MTPEQHQELLALADEVRRLDAEFDAQWPEERVEALEGLREFGEYDTLRFDLWGSQADIALQMAELIVAAQRGETK